MDIISKDNVKSMYDYAEEYYKIVDIIEKEEKRKITLEESLIIFAMLSE